MGLFESLINGEFNGIINRIIPAVGGIVFGKFMSFFGSFG